MEHDLRRLNAGLERLRGPGPRRTWRRTGARAARARSRRIDLCAIVLGRGVGDDDEAVGELAALAQREKYFWCDRIDVDSTSSGRSMNASSICPMITTGHSTSPVTSSSNPDRP